MKKLLALIWFLGLVSIGQTARLFSSGGELGTQGADVVAGVEFSAVFGISTTVTYGDNPVRSGHKAISCFSVDGAWFAHYLASSDQQADYYVRTYIYIKTIPSANTRILLFENVAGNDKVSVFLKTDRTLYLYNNEDAAQVGSVSSPLEAGRWY